MAPRASECGESKMRWFLDFPHWWELGGASGSATSPVSMGQTESHAAHTRTLPPGAHRRKEGGIFFSHFLFLRDLRGASSTSSTPNNFPRVYLLKKNLGNFLLSVYQTAFTCPAFQRDVVTLKCFFAPLALFLPLISLEVVVFK